MKEYLCLQRRHLNRRDKVTLVFVPLDEDEAIERVLSIVEKFDFLYLDETKIYTTEDIDFLQQTKPPKGQSLN